MIPQKKIILDYLERKAPRLAGMLTGAKLGQTQRLTQAAILKDFIQYVPYSEPKVIDKTEGTLKLMRALALVSYPGETSKYVTVYQMRDVPPGCKTIRTMFNALTYTGMWEGDRVSLLKKPITFQEPIAGLLSMSKPYAILLEDGNIYVDIHTGHSEPKVLPAFVRGIREDFGQMPLSRIFDQAQELQGMSGD
jgi:hypothetical protein